MILFTIPYGVWSIGVGHVHPYTREGYFFLTIARLSELREAQQPAPT